MQGARGIRHEIYIVPLEARSVETPWTWRGSGGSCTVSSLLDSSSGARAWSGKDSNGGGFDRSPSDGKAPMRAQSCSFPHPGRRVSDIFLLGCRLRRCAELRRCLRSLFGLTPAGLLRHFGFIGGEFPDCRGVFRFCSYSWHVRRASGAPFDTRSRSRSCGTMGMAEAS